MAIAQPADELGRFARTAASCISRSVASGRPQQVLAHRPVQQRRILRDHPDRAAQAVLRHVRDVLPSIRIVPPPTS